MSILSKLPAILSSVALANGVTLPIVLKKSSQKKEEETISLEVVEEIKPSRKPMPKIVGNRMKEAMAYIDCVQNTYKKNKELTEELKGKIKQDCRAKYWFWGELI